MKRGTDEQTCTKIEADYNCGERLLASQVLKVHFCCLPTPFDIILRGHTKNYLFEAN